jgi:hypothetical protein
MANTFKDLHPSDKVTTKTLLHEAIPLTGSIVSGTYGTAATALGSEPHIKTYSHGMFESVYDYPYLSSSANHIYDLTVGYGSRSAHSQNAKKINLYNQMAQVLMGHDITGSIKEFKIPGQSINMREVYFVNFSRLLTKDEVKKGSFSLEVGVNATSTQPFEKTIKLADTNGLTDYFTDSPAGEYAILSASNSMGTPLSGADNIATGDITFPVGLLFYQAGIAVLSASAFMINSGDAAGWNGRGILSASVDILRDQFETGTQTAHDTLTGSTIQRSCDGLRNRWKNLDFNNTTELNSTVHFCRMRHNEFNYSSNPTYVSGSKIRVKESSLDQPVSYVTTVGLYSAENELMAVAKLSEPIKKTPESELTLRVRLDF